MQLDFLRLTAQLIDLRNRIPWVNIINSFKPFCGFSGCLLMIEKQPFFKGRPGSI
jgi:hypothetical protein